MYAWLVSYSDNDHLFPLNIKSSCRIGRNPDKNDIRIKDMAVSGTHAVIDISCGRFYITDCDSRNGTVVSGKRINSRTEILPEQEVQIGSSLCRVIEVSEKELNSYEELQGGTFIRRKEIIEDSQTDPGGSIISELNITNLIKKKWNIYKFLFKNESIPDTAKAYNQLSILYEMASILNTIMDVDELFKLSLDFIKKGVNCDRSYVLMREHGEMKCKYKSEPRDTLVISRTIANKVMDEQTGIITLDAGQDDRFESSSSISEFSITSTMCVPVWIKEKAVGLLYLDNSISHRRFQDEDLHFLTAFASQLSLSLEKIHFVETIKKEEKIRNQLNRYLSPDVVSTMLKNPEKTKLGGERTDVVVLFADIRNFTRMSHEIPVDLMVNIINEYFTCLVTIVFEHKGTIDKFIGDEIMAVFGAPIPYKNNEFRAVQTAISIQKRLAELRMDWLKKYGVEFLIGIGISSGPVIAGNVGSEERMDYTIMGNPVNFASRICDIAPGNQIWISEDIFKKCGNRIKVAELDPVSIKGFDKQVSLFRVNY